MARQLIGGRYELEASPIARGGMGEVWVGRDTRLERPIAVKILRFPDGLTDNELVRRFVRESRITARLQHPGIPAVHDVGTLDDGRPYLVMQRIQGISVADLIAERGPLPVGWAVAIAAQTCAVLAVAHRSSLIHRDLKPANLMLCPDATVKVLDFGLAVALDLTDISRITQTGQTLGTPAYMAPEQVLGTHSVPQTDLYALGCTLHEMLTGQQLFTGPTAYKVMNQQVDERPPPVQQNRPDVDAGLDRLVLELLEKRHEKRPASAETVFSRLFGYVTDLRPLPPAVHQDASADPVRMYADVVSRAVDTADGSMPRPRSRDEAETASSSTTVTAHAAAGEPATDRPAIEPSPPAESDTTSFTRGELDRACREATELVRQSRYSQAADVLAVVAEPADHALGPYDPSVLDLRLELANALFEGGDYRRAGPVYRDLADRIARQHGEDAEQVHHCRLQEATCHALTGRTSTALDQLEALLGQQRQVHGPDEPRVLDLRKQIGLLQLGAGRRQEAERTLRELLADLERVHGHDHTTAREVRGILDGHHSRNR